MRSTRILFMFSFLLHVTTQPTDRQQKYKSPYRYCKNSDYRSSSSHWFCFLWSYSNSYVAHRLYAWSWSPSHPKRHININNFSSILLIPLLGGNTHFPLHLIPERGDEVIFNWVEAKRLVSFPLLPVSLFVLDDPQSGRRRPQQVSVVVESLSSLSDFYGKGTYRENL